MTTVPPTPDEPDDNRRNGEQTPPTDPFNVEALRADPGDDDIPTERIVHHLAVRKPAKTEFFRVHRDEAYTFDAYILERGEGIDRVAYLVVPAVAREVLQETSKRRILTCVNRTGKPFLWACKLPQPSNPSNSWITTALEVAESAKSYWVRMIPDLAGKQYEESRALALDDEPKWPEEPFGALLKLAFKNKLIEDYDHEVLRELRGEL